MKSIKRNEEKWLSIGMWCPKWLSLKTRDIYTLGLVLARVPRKKYKKTNLWAAQLSRGAQALFGWARLEKTPSTFLMKKTARPRPLVEQAPKWPNPCALETTCTSHAARFKSGRAAPILAHFSDSKSFLSLFTICFFVLAPFYSKST